MSKKIGNLNVAAGYSGVEACNGLRIKGKEKGGLRLIRSLSGVTVELPLIQLRIMNYELRTKKSHEYTNKKSIMNFEF
jgi:hypothetical protein